MTTIRNEAGTEIDFDAAVALMDDELREHLHEIIEVFEGEREFTAQQFFDDYVMLHREKFGEEFEPNKCNPVW
jgi:hypothetical protein